MTKQFIVLLFSCFILFNGCKETSKSNQGRTSTDLDILFKDFQDFKLLINPIEATKAGYSVYNDTIANYVSEAYQEKLVQEYTTCLLYTS